MAGVCPATVVFKEIFAKMWNYINNRLTVLTDEVTQDWKQRKKNSLVVFVTTLGKRNVPLQEEEAEE